ncbi:hypothetical protein [Sphingomonas koreensis]
MTSAPQNRHATNRTAARIGMLTRAAQLAGQERLAADMGIAARTLRAKCGVERGVTDADLRLASAALAGRAAEFIAQADAITAHLAITTTEAPCPTA